MSRAPREKSYEVVVVGAGVIGLACGWRAAQAGLSTLVVDRAGAGSGASGVAAGMLAPVTEAEFGEEALLALRMAGAGRWPAFDEELRAASGRETGYRRSGSLVVAADRDDAEELRRLHRFQRSLGLDAEWLARSECRELEPALSPSVAGAILAPQDHHVDPRALIPALGSALERAGGELAEGIEVGGIEGDGDGVRGVRTDAGTITARQVVAATGCWSAALPRAGEAPPVRPVKGQILRLRSESAGAPFGHVVRTPRCYIVSREGGEVAVGATVEERGFDTRVTADGVFRLLEAAREVLPDVAELELVEAAAGLRPGTPDNGPVVGSGTVPGLVWATGHYRNGLLLAPLTGDAVADMLSGADPPPELAPFSPARFAPAGAVGGAPERLAGRRS